MIPLVLVGCGAVSRQFYLPALSALAPLHEFRVHTVVDPNPAAREILLGAFPHAQPADTPGDAAAPRDSLAVIATPPRFHAEQTLAAFARGWHVLCEKPMAAGAAECDRMIAAARDANRLLAVGLYKRFFPASQYLRSVIAQNTLGRLRRIDIAEGGPFRWPAASVSFFDKAQTPGGVLLDIGVHVLDLLIWWLGEPSRVACADDAMGGLETNTVLELGFTRGGGGGDGGAEISARAHFSRDWATAQRYRFEFERGSITWRVNASDALTLHHDGTPSALRAQLVDPAGAAAQSTQPQAFIDQLRNIAAAIRGESPLLVSGEDGARSLRLIEKCYQVKTPLAQPWLAAPAKRTATGGRSSATP